MKANCNLSSYRISRRFLTKSGVFCIARW
jgi:hypothetical protein